jgi:hypothetical protein
LGKQLLQCPITHNAWFRVRRLIGREKSLSVRVERWTSQITEHFRV